jgi:hypothetical protein
LPGDSAAPGIAAGRGEDDHGEDEHAELERLRSEVRVLRAGQAGQAGQAKEAGMAAGQEAGRPAGGARRDWWRAPVAAIAIVLGCVLAPIAVLGVWAGNQVTNTDRFVANMAPLISEPPIQQALSAKITTVITTQLNVKGLEAQAADQLDSAHLPRLSALLRNFSGPISSGIDGLVGSAVTRVVSSPAIARLWTQANRTAHAGLVKVLSGQGNGAVGVTDGKVTISLGPFISQAEQELSQRGLTIVDKLPPVNPTIALFEAPDLSKAQSGYRLISALRWVLPFLSLALLAVGIYAARGRRRALLGAALGLSASMLVLAAALAIARGIYLNSVPQSTLPPDAAAALFDTLVRFIKDGLRVLLVAGLVIAAGAFLTGPSAAAVRTRRAAGSGLGWVRARGELAGLRTGPAGAWTGAHKRLLRICAVAVAALIFVFWGQPTVAVAIWIVILLLVVLGLIELIGGGRTGDAAPGDSGPGDTGSGDTGAGDTGAVDTAASDTGVPAPS